MSLKAFVPVGEIYRNATRPAIFSSIKTVLEFYGVKQMFDRVLFNGEADVTPLIFDDKDAPLRADQATEMLNTRRLYIVPDITRSVFNSGFGNSGLGANAPAAWKGEDLDVYIFPGYEGREINVACNCYFRTRAEAQNFVNIIERTRSRQLADFTFNANVHYPINPAILTFLQHLHQLGTKAGVITKDFAEWFYSSGIAPLGFITNEANTNGLAVVKRNVVDTNIIFTEPEIALAQKGEYSGQYLVTFSYRFYWQDMVEWQLSYPIQIYQQPIDEKYISQPQIQYKNGFVPNSFFEYFEGNRIFKNRTINSPFYYRYPEYDPWEPTGLRWLDKQASALLTLTDEANEILMNIDDLPNWKWKPIVKKIMLRYKEKVFKRHANLIHIKVYSDDITVLNTQLSLDEDGNIRLDRTPTMGNCYRVCFFIDLDFKGLDPDGIYDITNDEEYQKEFLPCVFPWHRWDIVPNDGSVTPSRGDGRWPSELDPNSWINSKDDWYAHADAWDMGDGTVRFSPVFYELDLGLIAKT